MGKKLKRFTVKIDVESANGWQLFDVMAANEDDAIERFKSGEGDFLEEYIEVTAIGDPEIFNE